MLGRALARPKSKVPGRQLIFESFDGTNAVKETYFGSPPQSQSSNSHPVLLSLLVTCGFSNSRILNIKTRAAPLLRKRYTLRMPPAPKSGAGDGQGLCGRWIGQGSPHSLGWVVFGDVRRFCQEVGQNGFSTL